MLSIRAGLRSARFVNKTGLHRLGGSVAAFRANVPLPWDVASYLHEQSRGTNLLEDVHRKKFFQPAGPHALTSEATASYVAVTDEDVKRVPEGFAGELEHDFLFVGLDKPKNWMIRDAGKLVCNLLDEYKMSKQEDPTNYNRPEAKSYYNFDFEGLTDRPEWHDAAMNVQHYGENLLFLPKKSLKASGGRQFEYEGNVTENFLGAIKEKIPEIPTRIMLTGECFFFVSCHYTLCILLFQSVGNPIGVRSCQLTFACTTTSETPTCTFLQVTAALARAWRSTRPSCTHDATTGLCCSSPTGGSTPRAVPISSLV